MTSVFEPLVADLRAIFAGRLRSVALYGRHVDSAPPPRGTPVHAIALVSGTIGMDDLEGCARQAPRWTRDGFAIPLVLGEEEFARSLDAFPVEFGAILAQHIDLACHRVALMYSHGPDHNSRQRRCVRHAVRR